MNDRAEAVDHDQIQGNIAGFNKDHQRLVFLKFADPATGKAFLGEISDYVATSDEVRQFNKLFKLTKARRHGSEAVLDATWMNIALSFAGLQAIGAPGNETLPEEFRQGMAARAGTIGDTDNSAPGTWEPPFDVPADVHAIVVIAADDKSDLEEIYGSLKRRVDSHQVAELGQQDGNTRDAPNTGHEHFGFKDGISQPAVRGFDTEREHRGELLPTGRFVLGYSNGEPPPAPAPTPEPSPYPAPTPPPDPVAQPLPDWTKNGSFLVYRRLRQDVKGFKDFIAANTGPLGLSEDLLRAKLVGRYQSGAPLETAGNNPVDPNAGGESSDNDFGYGHDADGANVPRAAHIRKTYPRDQQPPGEEESNRHRILRRGIPYGLDFVETEPGYGQVVPPEQDRGLLFLCYQASIQDQFEFIQQIWANTNDFPEPADGRDPIISQDVASPTFTISGHDALTLQRWVITRGGEYFFSPSIDALKGFAAG